MRLYAYTRVSTHRQSIKRQIDNIASANNGAYAGALFFSDTSAGSAFDRPEWNRLYKQLKAGDTIVFDSVSRLSRDAESGASLYEDLYRKGVNLIFLNEPHCNTDCYRQAAAASIPPTGNEIADIYIEATNKVLMLLARNQIVLAFEQAEKERLDLCNRVKDGMKAAKDEAARQGIEKRYGLAPGTKLTTQKSISAKEIILNHSKDFNGTLEDPEVIKLCGISRNTFYRYKRQLKQEAGEATELGENQR